MAVFTLDGTAYPVSPTVTARRMRLDHQRRAFSGNMRSALHHDSHTVARTWDVPIGLLTEAEARAVEADLVKPGTVVIGGDIIGATVTCVCVDRSRQDGPIADAVMVQASFSEEIA